MWQECKGTVCNGTESGDSNIEDYQGQEEVAANRASD